MICQGIVKLTFPALDCEMGRIERDQVYPTLPMIIDDLRDIERLAREQRWRSAVRLTARILLMMVIRARDGGAI